jgi:DNA-binding response OmpR family regulator
MNGIPADAAHASADPAAESARTILVVEDDRDLSSVLQRMLSNTGYHVETAGDGETGLTRALELQPDLLILDVGLPNRDGFDLTRALRARGLTAPVLMLTARTSVSDKVSGLDAGADDYLPKPFEHAELMARVKALLRRSSIASASSLLHVRDLTLDPIARRVERAGKPIEMTQKEYALLEFLMRNAGRPVTRQAIAERVWHTETDPATNVVDVYINYVRKKIEDDKTRPLIQTVRGTGYMIRE